MQFGLIGSGSWGTALAKILTDNNNTINWWMRNTDSIDYIQKRKHNPHYLNGAYFNTELLKLNNDIKKVVAESDVLVIATPSAFADAALQLLDKDAFEGKQIVSAIKGILPAQNQLLNEYLAQQFNVDLSDYFTVLGPCHAEEVAAEKLSYLTFSGLDETKAAAIATYFKNDYLNTVINHDVIGVQYAAILKNIYALGAGIAHGLEYGDNFLSVYIANAANEMVGFLKKLVQGNNEKIATGANLRNDESSKALNYAASVYLGDLLVTCYSLYSRNRTFGNMIGKGYSVKSAQLELNMVAEGYNASKSVYKKNREVGAGIPIAETIYKILWEHQPAAEGFNEMEGLLD